MATMSKEEMASAKEEALKSREEDEKRVERLKRNLACLEEAFELRKMLFSFRKSMSEGRLSLTHLMTSTQLNSCSLSSTSPHDTSCHLMSCPSAHFHFPSSPMSAPFTNPWYRTLSRRACCSMSASSRTWKLATRRTLVRKSSWPEDKWAS